MKPVKLTAELIEAFAGTFLSPMYDNLAPTPELHREGWALYCSDDPRIALAAPRKHAKSTAFTHVFGLASALFRIEPYIIILGSTEEMAIEHLGDIANELRTNEDLRREFQIKRFITDQKMDVIVECEDGYQFRFLARGAEQKIRGKKWRGRRPGLIVGDDIEDDEQVENRDRRSKFMRWLLRAAIQALRKGGKIRVHGTILHPDSALAKLMRMKSWTHRLYRAHKSFDDFSEILWPEQFTEEGLRAIRQTFIDAGDSAGYSQEYLNDPQDRSDVYLRRENFLPMTPEDFESPKIVCAAADFAISKSDKANRTSLTVGGRGLDNCLCILDEEKGRWDSPEIIDEIFAIQKKWHPDVFFVEHGQIWLALQPMLMREMQKRGVWINFDSIKSSKDKAVRGRVMQKLHKGRGMRFDKQASWYEEYEYELLRFTELAEAELDDQFDSTSLLCIGFEKLGDVDEDDFADDEEWLLKHARPQDLHGVADAVEPGWQTGYNR